MAKAASPRDGEDVGLLLGSDGAARDDDDDIFGDGQQRHSDSQPPPPPAIAASTSSAPATSGQRMPPPSLAMPVQNGSSYSNGGSLRNPGTPRTPRTPNRVRFDLRPQVAADPASAAPSDPSSPASSNGHAAPRAGGIRSARTTGHGGDGDDDDDDDDEDDDGFDFAMAPENALLDRQHRQPLLTDMEAPAVTLARSGEIDTGMDVEAWAARERNRPKSGLSSAFMNMANSIIGAGIIGQPYAMRQAGLVAGVVLLVVLTVAVDWTIRLIVVNSKLSGASSFQGTVEHCFGRPGLIAISLAQWVFAFGGMVAFGVIVGDSIPHVLTAVWPGLRDVPVLGLLTDRRIVIIVFILAVSYPLTLYRDIAKVGPSPPRVSFSL